MPPDLTTAQIDDATAEPGYVYAVGDIHGRMDLLERLYAELRADAAALGQGPPGLVFLGDYVDRGPASDQVVEFVRTIPETEFEVTPLLGNHEAVMLAFLDDPQVGTDWRRHGGLETLQSYGVTPPEHDSGWRDAAEALSVALPMEHLSFLYSLRHTHEWGGYFFCHAGVHPERDLNDQSLEDLLWIREPFLSHPTPLARTIVHGHTINEAIHSDAVRIGLDTGAYRSGVLSAVRLGRSAERVFFTATVDGVTRRTETPAPPRRSPRAPSPPELAPLQGRLRSLARHMHALSEQPWPASTRGEAMRRLGVLERDWRELVALTDPDRSAPPARPAAPPAEVAQIVDWLESIGVALRLILPARLSEPALRAARAGDLEEAVAMVEAIAPTSIQRTRRELHHHHDRRPAIEALLAQFPNAGDEAITDDVLRLHLFMRAVLGQT